MGEVEKLLLKKGKICKTPYIVPIGPQACAGALKLGEPASPLMRWLMICKYANGMSLSKGVGWVEHGNNRQDPTMSNFMVIFFFFKKLTCRNALVLQGSNFNSPPSLTFTRKKCYTTLSANVAMSGNKKKFQKLLTPKHQWANGHVESKTTSN
jgi:hypothetical protein